MTDFVLDTFSRIGNLFASDGETGAHWAQYGTNTAEFLMDGAVLYEGPGSSGGIRSAYPSGTPASANYGVEVSITFDTTYYNDMRFALFLRTINPSGGGDRAIECFYRVSTGNLYLDAYDDGVGFNDNDLGNVGPTVSGTYVFNFSVSGNTATLKIDGVTMGTLDVSTVNVAAAGTPAFSLGDISFGAGPLSNTESIRLNNFRAYSISGSTEADIVAVESKDTAFMTAGGSFIAAIESRDTSAIGTSVTTSAAVAATESTDTSAVVAIAADIATIAAVESSDTVHLTTALTLLVESFTAQDRQSMSVTSLVVESFTAADASELTRGYALVESGVASCVLASNGQFNNSVVEHGTTTDAVALAVSNNNVESGTISSTTVLSVDSVLEEQGVETSVATISTAITDIEAVESAVATDALTSTIIGPPVVESMTGSTTIANTFEMSNNVVEAGTVTHVLAHAVAMTLGESGSFAEAVAQSAVTAQNIVESGFLSDVLQGGGVYGAWTAHLEPFAMSRYTNTPFHSLAVVDGVLLGTSDEGVFRLDANKDAGVNIDASLVHDWSDKVLDRNNDMRTSEYAKHPRFLYMGALTAGAMQCTLGYVGRNGNEAFGQYNFLTKNAGAFATTRAILGRGITSRYLRPAFNNVDGAPFSIVDATLVVDPTVRRT